MMSDLDELIAAGEAAIEERSQKLSFSHKTSCALSQSIGSSIWNKYSTSADVSDFRNSESSIADFNRSKTRSTVPLSIIEDSAQGVEEPHLSNGNTNTGKILLDVGEDSKDNSKKPLLLLLKNQCAEIFSLSLSMGSSLSNANRLLTTLAKGQPENSPYTTNLLHEITLCEESCKSNEKSLEKVGEEFHHILAKLSDQQRTSEYQENELKHAIDRASSIINIITELLGKTGFKHLAPNINSASASIERLLEEIHIGLTLLSGELPEHTLQSCNQQLQSALAKEDKLKSQLSQMQEQMVELRKMKEKEICHLQVQLEKYQKDLQDMEYHFHSAEEDKIQWRKSFDCQLGESEEEVLHIRQQMIQMEHATKQRIKEAEEKYKDKQDNTKTLTEELSALKNSFSLKEQQIEVIQEEANGVTKNLRNKVSKLETEMATLRSKVSETEREKQFLKDKIKNIQTSVPDYVKQKNEAQEEVVRIIDKMEQLTANSNEEMMDLQSKVDSVSATLCEKNSEVRSRDVKIMQLQTELTMEGQKSAVLTGETELLEKQVKRLQERINKLLEGKPKEAKFVSFSTDAEDSVDGGVRNPQPRPDQSAAKEMLRSHEREGRLQRLLEQKDDEMRSLRVALESRLLQKNSDMEKLSCAVETLEKEMEGINSSLNASKNMADVTQHTAIALGARTQALTQLENRSIRLQSDCARMSVKSSDLEAKGEEIQELNDELASFKMALREAKKDARLSRMEAATEKQKTTLLQIDLESARDSLKQTRLEQDLLQSLPAVKKRTNSLRESLSIDIGSVAGASPLTSRRSSLNGMEGC